MTQKRHLGWGKFRPPSFSRCKLRILRLQDINWFKLKDETKKKIDPQKDNYSTKVWKPKKFVGPGSGWNHHMKINFSLFLQVGMGPHFFGQLQCRNWEKIETDPQVARIKSTNQSSYHLLTQGKSQLGPPHGPWFFCANKRPAKLGHANYWLEPRM